MNEIVIRTAGVSKSYRPIEKPWHRLLEGLGLNRDENPVDALHPTDVEIRRGESVGIVGRNGSGKSTLLALIAGILTPTSGTVERFGRISALLELGSGFNPEFTGRENVFFTGSLMGLTRDEMRARYPEINAFAEIGDFIDRPVKTYSSGMFVRLAFATAIHVNPDVCIIDEALSVGDIYFQQKCFDRLRLMREQGVSLLFVSHDSSAITRFCDRALLMEAGRVTYDSDPLSVIRAYESRLIQIRDAVAAAEGATNGTPHVMKEIATADAVVEFFGVIDANEEPISAFVSEERVSVRTVLRFNTALDDPHCGFKIRNRFGEVVFETNTYCVNHFAGPVRAGERINVDFSFAAPLAEGDYTLSLGVADRGYGEGIFRRQLIYSDERSGFKVLRNPTSIQWSGVVNLAPDCSISRSAS